MKRKEDALVVVVIIFVIALAFGFNPFKQKEPDWQVIKEALASVTYCADTELVGDEDEAIGFAPCVRLVNVTFDTKLDKSYCYSADVEVGGFPGENYNWITSWDKRGSEYYCVTWYPKYVESDTTNPDDWRIVFGTNSPSTYVQ